MPLSESAQWTLWKLISNAILALTAATLLSSIIWKPSKRNLELLAGVAFIGLAIIARPIQMLAFCIILLPYPMYTSVGSTSTLLILAVGALGMMKARLYRLESPFYDGTSDRALFGFLLMIVLSLYQVATENLHYALDLVVGIFSATVLYYTVVQLVTNEKSFEFVFKAFMCIAASVALVGTLQTLFPEKMWLPVFFQSSARLKLFDTMSIHDARVYASFHGISSFAEFVSISIVYQYVLLRNTRNLYMRVFWIASIVMFLIALAGSATRMGVIALAFGFFYILVFGSRAIPRFQILSILFVVISIFALSYPFISPLTAQMEDRLAGLGPKDSSAQSRWGVMSQALEGIPDAPFLGHGIFVPAGTFRGGVSRTIHCLYLTLPYTIGLPGLLAFVWWVAVLFRRTARHMNNLNLPRKHREYALAMNTSIVMFLLYEMTGEFLTHVMDMHMTFLRFGLALAIVKVCDRQLAGFGDGPGEARRGLLV